ncbi:alpha-(1,3)-fucosyltransferase 9-like [Austrofundulus limnaeus]|uniref:Fucosyltransferase n=1 Tax=Austrofundulus limnaeus TaxID=52670 RepID=A0A2I4BBN1_AUSLI|nr:PREDICTED: alpha-(1,3)-fucosyltransferase 9-like [Austrofundulus limnaeus]
MSSTTPNKILQPLLVTVVILGCFMTIFFTYFKPSNYYWLNGQSTVSPHQVKSSISTTKNESVITVLVWLWPFGARFALDVCSSKYNTEGCFITADRNLYKKSDAVVFHHRDIHGDLSNLPSQQRPSFQKWIWLNLESPTHSPLLPGLNTLFNLTLNYRQDSDIKATYGLIVPAETEEDFVPPKKDKLVCWIVSNWSPNHARIKYYNELKNHIQIQLYGRAFRRYLSNEDYAPIVSSCKFYLSFENSIHVDYITEKFYKPLSLGTVPVALGTTRQNYENFIQGDAFIHVDDFSSPKELAEYLLFMDKTQDMYLRFFKWRRHFKSYPYDSWAERMCHVCVYLKLHKEYKSINNLNKWYWG